MIIFEMLILKSKRTFLASIFFPSGKGFVSRQAQMDVPRFSQGSHHEWNLEEFFPLFLGSAFSSFIKQFSSWVMYGFLDLDVWNVHCNFANMNLWKWKPLGTPTEETDDWLWWNRVQEYIQMKELELARMLLTPVWKGRKRRQIVTWEEGTK